MRQTAICGAVAAMILAVTSAAAADREVQIPGGKATLGGSLRMPTRFVAGPAVLMISGSGPTDRNGDSHIAGVKPANMLLLADTLEAKGIPSLRFDKRGLGASAAAGPPEADLRFGTFVEDAAAWARRLASEPGVTCVVLFGHSEGALIAALASTKAQVCGVVSAAGLGRPFDDVVLGQLAAQDVPAAVLDKARQTFATLRHGETTSDFAPAPAALFRVSVQPYLISLLQADPEKAIATARGPVMILQGDRDLQIGIEDAERLKAARPDAQLTIIKGANHVFKSAPEDRAANLATYADPTIPLATGVAKAVVTFVQAHATTQ